jgi:hypothetical protein
MISCLIHLEIAFASVDYSKVVLIGFFANAPDIGGDDHVVRLIRGSHVKCHDDHFRMTCQSLVDELLRVILCTLTQSVLSNQQQTTDDSQAHRIRFHRLLLVPAKPASGSVCR